MNYLVAAIGDWNKDVLIKFRPKKEPCGGIVCMELAR